MNFCIFLVCLAIKREFMGYTLWLFNIAMENPLLMEVLMGKSTINCHFNSELLVITRG